MAQWLRTLAALPEDLGSIPRTHMTAHHPLELQSQGFLHPLPASSVTRSTHGTQTQAGKPHHIVKWGECQHGAQPPPSWPRRAVR